jgi:hypothetical protein
MAYEEIGIRMRADGVVETSNGVTLTGKAVEDLGEIQNIGRRLQCFNNGLAYSFRCGLPKRPTDFSGLLRYGINDR